jgi:hypothetical protein
VSALSGLTTPCPIHAPNARKPPLGAMRSESGQTSDAEARLANGETRRNV